MSSQNFDKLKFTPRCVVMERIVILKYTALLVLFFNISQIILYIFSGISRLKDHELNDWKRTLGTPRNSQDYEIICGSQFRDDIHANKLKEVVKLIHKAGIYSRGSKTSNLISKSLDLLNDFLIQLHYNVTKLHSRETVQSTSVCPEEFKGTKFGYPFYHKGFEIKKCSYEKPLSQLLTIILDPVVFSDRQIFSYELREINIFSLTLDSNLLVIVSSFERNVESNYKNINFVYVGDTSPGNKWNTLIKAARTQYVLIARGVNLLTSDIRLKRLIREIESQGIPIAGAATRDQQGHWRIGCKQSVFKNYTITYEDGYFESLHECIFCDHIDGPFIAKKTIFDEIPLHIELLETGLFEDFFLRFKAKYEESIICPDSMFFIRSSSEFDKRKWLPFAKVWSLYKLKINSKEMVFPCTFSDCFNRGHIIPPCCLEELSSAIKLLMRSCEDAGMFCEITDGTLLGAVKFSMVLPWERDADIVFLSADYTTFKKLRRDFENAGYNLSDGRSIWCCGDTRTDAAAYKLYSKNWYIELWGQYLIDSQILATTELKATKLFFNGIWVTGPTNPGLVARNRYGHEIYRHSQHWLDLGAETEWINYGTNKFTKCSHPHSHSCLDQYKTDGNIQFSDPVP